MPIFANSFQKSVTVATPLDRSRKNGRIDHAPICVPMLVNLVKMGPVHSEIIGHHGDR